ARDATKKNTAALKRPRMARDYHETAPWNVSGVAKNKRLGADEKTPGRPRSGEKSAGKDFRGHTTRGNRGLRSTLTEWAWAVSRSQKSTLRDQFWRWAVAGTIIVVLRVVIPLPVPE